MKRLTLALLLLCPLAAGAADETGDGEIYRTTDEDGNVIYTDTPPSEDAEPVELDPINTVPGIETEPRTEGDRDPGEGEPPAPVVYSGVEIVYPGADEAIRHNGGQVPFRVRLQPEGTQLAEAHRVEIVLDGSTAGSGNSLEVTVGPVNRGPHRVSARVVDGEGNVLARSGTVEFFLLRHSIQQP